MKGARLLAAAVIVAVAAAVVGGVLVLGSPSEQRLRRLDARRVEDLRRIAWAVDRYWARHDSLPPDLAALVEADGPEPPRRDPATGAPYGYRVAGVEAYELCAVFARPSEDEPPPAPPRRDWSHGVGECCFRLEPRAGDGVGAPAAGYD
ncbi:MAG: hypothetical protein JW819_08620 [Candidatus Krumholzibacteriota bacterium]|nr:hypothetical protein [Candidatus Krumholzibacteriota bacterium]